MKNKTEKVHILVLSKGFIFVSENVNSGKGDVLGEKYTGDFSNLVMSRKFLESNDQPFGVVGCYISSVLAERLPTFCTIYYFLVTLFKIMYRHFFIKKYNCVIARNPILDGLLASIFCKLTGTPLIVEFNGNYAAVENWDADNHGLVHSIKSRLVKRIIPIVARCATKIRLLYPEQADLLIDEKDGNKTFVMHEFVPIEKNLNLEYTEPEKIISCIGGPWHVKGIDTLIRAFNKVSPIYNDYKLCIHTWSMKNDEKYLFDLVDRSNTVIGKPIAYKEAQNLISKSAIVVLASRTEAMGRVLVEAMSYSRPVIGSDVDGIPTYIKDNKNGLLVRPGDVKELAAAIEELILDSEKAEILGKEGKRMAKENWTETQYLKKYGQVIDELSL